MNGFTNDLSAKLESGHIKYEVEENSRNTESICIIQLRSYFNEVENPHYFTQSKDVLTVN